MREREHPCQNRPESVRSRRPAPSGTCHLTSRREPTVLVVAKHQLSIRPGGPTNKGHALDGLAQAHLVGQHRVEVAGPGVHHPVDARQLVVPQRAPTCQPQVSGQQRGQEVDFQGRFQKEGRAMMTTARLSNGCRMEVPQRPPTCQPHPKHEAPKPCVQGVWSDRCNKHHAGLRSTRQGKKRAWQLA